MGRLVRNHSTNILGLIKWLKKMSQMPEIKTITPAVLSSSNGRMEQLTIKVSRKTSEGYKLIARKGKLVQEVYIVTSLEMKNIREIIENTNPYISQKKKLP